MCEGVWSATSLPGYPGSSRGRTPQKLEKRTQLLGQGVESERMIDLGEGRGSGQGAEVHFQSWNSSPTISPSGEGRAREDLQEVAELQGLHYVRAPLQKCLRDP